MEFPTTDGFSHQSNGFRGISQIIRDLQKTRLVEPHPDGYGYVVAGQIRFALDKNHGAKDRTAQALGIDRKTLYKKLRELDPAKVPMN